MKIDPKISLLALMTLALASGCSKGEKSIKDSFLETQGATVLPHGRIKAESVQAISDNKIRYETESGDVFQVTAEKQNGGYRYSAAEKIK